MVEAVVYQNHPGRSVGMLVVHCLTGKRHKHLAEADRLFESVSQVTLGHMAKPGVGYLRLKGYDGVMIKSNCFILKIEVENEV